MTRWDCDVKLRRGIPSSFPAFHGWPPSRFLCDQPVAVDNLVLSSTASARFTCCRACFQWVPENSPHHACAPTPTRHNLAEPPAEPPAETPADWEDAEDSEEEPERVYVVSTENNSKNQRCHLCTERMSMEFLQDIEEWVFVGCVEHEGVPVHKLCRVCAHGY